MVETHHPTDEESRALALSLLGGAVHAALATLYNDAPLVTRVGCLWLPGQGLGLLLSDLSDHAKALRQDARCSALVGEPGTRGDPLTHPRLTLIGAAEQADKSTHRDVWLEARPKSKLYFDFADFTLRILRPSSAVLNGGFGKAYRPTPADLGLAP